MKAFILSFLLAVMPNLAVAQTRPDSILPGSPCHGQTPCALDGREYHVKEPDGWDGVSPLPVLLHFHGWARTGAIPVYNARISGATRRRGVLLIAPSGLNKTWNFRASDSDDIAFADAVLADVKRRYPIDETRIYISGYSYGGLMAWRYACENGNGIAAMLGISAALPQTTNCTQAPREVREVYGLRDTVLDFPFGPGGDTSYPVQLWRDAYGCGAALPDTGWTGPDDRAYTRRVWACGDNAVTLDLHPGGHLIPPGWIARQLDELLGLNPS